MLVALGKGLEIVVSHRSKSPNDDMEAHVALAANALGLKAGGGANTERLVKYQAVTEQLLALDEARAKDGLAGGEQAIIRKIRAYEEPTNAGIPTVGATVDVGLPSPGYLSRSKGRLRWARRPAPARPSTWWMPPSSTRTGRSSSIATPPSSGRSSRVSTLSGRASTKRGSAPSSTTR
jgi:hypothetical protein